MNGQQQVVAAGGAALVLANFWLGGARGTVSTGVFNGGASAQQTADAHSELKKFAGELAFVAVATLLAGLSSQAGTAMVAVIAALFLVWAMNHFTSPDATTTPSASHIQQPTVVPA